MTWPEDGDSMPYVCPSCFAVGDEPCGSGCAEQARLDRQELSDERYDSSYDHIGALIDSELEPYDDAEGDGGDDDTLNAVALLESALDRHEPEESGLDWSGPAQPAPPEPEDWWEVSATELLAQIDAIEGELLLGDGDDEPEEPTEVMARPSPVVRLADPETAWLEPQDVRLEHQDSVLCACQRWLPFHIIAPPRAIERGLVSPATLTCACGTTIGLVYGWRQGAVISVRLSREKAPVMN